MEVKLNEVLVEKYRHCCMVADRSQSLMFPIIVTMYYIAEIRMIKCRLSFFPIG